MKEEFILKLFEKFEKGTSVVMHIKEGENEFVLKKEGAFAKQDLPAACSPLPSVMYAAPPAFIPSGGGATSGQAVSSASTVESSSAAVQDVPAAVSPSVDKNLVFVKSPIVGTFYRSPSPDSPPYVEKGSAVKKGQPLCVLEAMKMMNTLECEYDGVIEDILASNGDLVEFDRNIFVIRVK